MREVSSLAEHVDMDAHFDVGIVGGGLAGQCLALQLKRDLPDVSVVVFDRLARPLPEAAFKVGEATVEMGAHYLAERLGLAGYLEDRHLLKMGLRYYFGDAAGPFGERPEMGLSAPPAFDSYLIDRGRLESDLRDMIAARGVSLIEGVTVDDIDLSDNGGPHTIGCRSQNGEPPRRVSVRWVVDATGRRRMLQRKLGLAVPEQSRCSAAWFRVDGRVRIDELVPEENTEWHTRVTQGLRDTGVIHLLGAGYWVWIIALPSQSTSIGIVTNDEIHPVSTYGRQERALEWLAAHEPVLAEYLETFPILDFMVMKRYSHTSRQVFSADRWSCVGDAAVFADPLFAPGVDMIGVGNTITVEMIRRDLDGKLRDEDVERWSRWVIALNQALTANIQVGYPLFGHKSAASAKLLWDFAAAWGYEAPQMLNQTYLDFEDSAPLNEAIKPFFLLQLRMQKMFADWARLPAGRAEYRFLDYFTFRYLTELRDRNLKAGKSMEELVEDARVNMEILEELAQALFLVAVEDQFPEYLDRFPDPVWLNAWAVGVDPEQWESDGLFSPRTEPRDITWIRDELLAGLGVAAR